MEAVRAGRDGAPSFCELVYFEEDLAIQQNFIGWANPSREYLFGVYETLERWGERVQAKDLDDLRDELLVKNRADNRVSICLKWLEVLGVTRGAFETHDLELVCRLDPAELPDFVGSEEKRTGDLEGLAEMMRFANGDGTCRRFQLARHFGLDEPKEDSPPCGACDACADTQTWMSEKFEARPAKTLQVERNAAFQRGDWVRIDGRHLGHVVSVEGDGRSMRFIVESAGDFRRRKVDPRRSEVERVDN